MDVALTFAQMLRAKGVVGCFVECFGPGLATPERHATHVHIEHDA